MRWSSSNWEMPCRLRNALDNIAEGVSGAAPAEPKYQVFEDVLYPGWWSVCTRDENGRMYCLHDGRHNHQGDANRHARELNDGKER